MKKRSCFIIAFIMILAVMALTACGGTLSIDCSNEKAVHVEAKNADKDDWVVTGSLTVEEGETISFTANMEQGEIKLELFGTAEEQSIDELPEEPAGEAVATFVASGMDSMSATNAAAGSYMIKATVTEKATGTVDITAAP